MKKIFFAVVLVIMSISFSACERNDYQHPMHRK